MRTAGHRACWQKVPLQPTQNIWVVAVSALLVTLTYQVPVLRSAGTIAERRICELRVWHKRFRLLKGMRQERCVFSWECIRAALPLKRSHAPLSTPFLTDPRIAWPPRGLATTPQPCGADRTRCVALDAPPFFKRARVHDVEAELIEQMGNGSLRTLVVTGNRQRATILRPRRLPVGVSSAA